VSSRLVNLFLSLPSYVALHYQIHSKPNHRAPLCHTVISPFLEVLVVAVLLLMLLSDLTQIQLLHLFLDFFLLLALLAKLILQKLAVLLAAQMLGSGFNLWELHSIASWSVKTFAKASINLVPKISFAQQDKE